MAELSPTLDRRTTKTRSVLFGALRSKGHGKVADALGVSESTFSEWLNKNSDRICQLLTAIEHKPVPLTNICYPPEHLAHMEYFAQIGMRYANQEHLEFDDE